MKIFDLRKLSYSYPGCKARAIDNIDLCLNRGDFHLVMGPSGCGKSTLLRLLAGLIPHFYGGDLSGGFYFKDRIHSDLTREDYQEKVGMVFQDPEKQIVMNRVGKDLGFGLENLDMDRKKIEDRVATISRLLGFDGLLFERTSLLSSGQKQKLAIGSILAMSPEILLLDEPTSQLDEGSTAELLDILKNLKQELGMTIIVSEHRTGELLKLADKCIFLDRGKIVFHGGTMEFLKDTPEIASRFVPDMAGSITAGANSRRNPIVRLESNDLREKHERTIIECRNLSFSYTKNRSILSNINFSVGEGEIAALLGKNGAGKSTLAKLLSGLLKPDFGRIILAGKDITEFNSRERASNIAYLSQNPDDYLFCDTVIEEMAFKLKNLRIPDTGGLDTLLDCLHLKDVKYSYPRALSSGQKQRVALASILAGNPRVVILDEPTRGIDPILKDDLAKFLQYLSGETGAAVLLITQDKDFALSFSHQTYLLGDGC